MEVATNEKASVVGGQRRVRVAVNGSLGRMGRRLCVLALQRDDLELVAALEYSSHQAIGSLLRDSVPDVPRDCPVKVSRLTSDVLTQVDVVIDFSSPEGTAALADMATAAAKTATGGGGLVVGTTGLNEEQRTALRRAAECVPVLHAMNFSLGVNLMFKVAAQIAATLGDEFNIEIVETHHNQKVDAPSGTALGLAESICAATGRDPKADVVNGREGRPGKRSVKEIGMHAVRIGNVVGDHTVHFGSPYERIELTHRAEERDVFASGALRSAVWVSCRTPGMYSMSDVLEKV